MRTNQITLVCFIKAKENTKQLVEQKLKYLTAITSKEKGNINLWLLDSSFSSLSSVQSAPRGLRAHPTGH
jgi:hypothetical protein